MVVIGNKGMTETNINARALMLTESQIVGLLGPGSPEEGKEVLAGTFAGRFCQQRPIHMPYLSKEACSCAISGNRVLVCNMCARGHACVCACA